jgi:ABC-2 type transport system permease protein
MSAGPNDPNLEFAAKGTAGSSAIPSPNAPIADLSYRNYDGPIHTRAVRWWIVALNTIRLAIKKKGFWVVAVVAALPYLLFGFILYLQSSIAAGTGGGGGGMLMGEENGRKFTVAFFQAFGQQSLWLFIISLMVGSGSIAADNQANALLVYLSKPLTKGDYLLGKWMGIFVMVFAVAFAPALLLYFYCLLSYTSDGFFSQDPLLFFRVIGACAVPAAVHASMLVGISAWSKTPRMAGAIYAGVYFVSLAVANIMWGILYRGDIQEGNVERHLSIPGIAEGLAQNVFHVSPTIPLSPIVLKEPDLLPMLVAGLAIVALGVMAARSRIRAVEVVGG